VLKTGNDASIGIRVIFCGPEGLVIVRAGPARLLCFDQAEEFAFVAAPRCVYDDQSIHNDRIVEMRTNIEIDDELLSQAMTAAGLSTKRATVEEGLRLLVRVRKQAKALADLKGLGWEGDLDEMRQGRPPRRS
jgi:Arc/MetJ family transcription regulator